MTRARPRHKRISRTIGTWILVAFCLWLLTGWMVLSLVTAPDPSPIVPIGSLSGVPVSDVSTVTADGIEVQGWLARKSDRRVVLLFAGKGGNRQSLLGLASHYLDRDWSVLLPDLRATGTSGGDRVGLGYLERLDVDAWVESARARGFVDIALHGQSLGAAAIAFWAAESGDDGISFLVLDSCYDNLRNALVNRLPFVPLPRLVLKPIEWFGSIALGASPDDLRPVACVRSIRSPVLFLAGDLDSKVLPAETTRLFEACGSPHKQLRWMRNGRHMNLWYHDPQAYAQALDAFLDTVKVRPSNPASG